ncbi:MAG: flagellar motor protein MotB, partial [Anaerolineae bacterium]|nr:flagellar motor protein MotB [Anaerolineae bacterium]
CEKGFQDPNAEATPEIVATVDPNDCVMPPAPGEPPLPPSEKRPLCAPPPAPTAGAGNIVVPTGIGIFRPGFRAPTATPTATPIGS